MYDAASAKHRCTYRLRPTGCRPVAFPHLQTVTVRNASEDLWFDGFFSIHKTVGVKQDVFLIPLAVKPLSASSLHCLCRTCLDTLA